MKDTKNINVISTPNIEGNIGSCTVQGNEVKVHTSLFLQDYKSVQVNSCTGQIISENVYTDYTGVLALICLGSILVTIAVGSVFAYLAHKYE